MLSANSFHLVAKTWKPSCVEGIEPLAGMCARWHNSVLGTRSYRRGDLFEKRRELMDAWAKFCTTSAAEHAATKA